MKTKMLFAAALAGAVFFSCKEQKAPVEELYSRVDPYIGAGGHGHVFVGASVPFGAVQAGPNNIHKGWDWCSGYHYSDSIIIGFSQTHSEWDRLLRYGRYTVDALSGRCKDRSGRAR